MREEGERNWPFVGGEGFISRKRGLNVGEKVSGWCWNAWMSLTFAYQYLSSRLS